jgi:UDP-2,4-diacetamido-2,4,6-trideoxy-beta-L-altropyranose hydrolase
MSGGEGSTLLLRADGGSSIGLGHAMRVIALGEAWIEHGGRASWLVAEAPPSVVERANAAGVSIERIRSAPGSAEDAGTLRQRIAADGASVAVIDGGVFGDAYFDALAPVWGRVAVIDDMALLDRYPVGLVLNQNAHADRASYPQDAGTTYLLGLDYVLLRGEFRRAEPAPALPERAGRLLISFGGADPKGMTARAIRAIAGPGAEAERLDVTVVVGPANAAGEAIEQVAAAAPFSVHVVRDVERMTDLMAATDLALVSGGSTVWELARMGVPALVVETAPLEADLARGLGIVGLFERLGPAESLDDATLAASVAARIDDRPWRTEMSERGRRLVDGRGADRVVEALGKLDTGGATGTHMAAAVGGARRAVVDGNDR